MLSWLPADAGSSSLRHVGLTKAQLLETLVKDHSETILRHYSAANLTQRIAAVVNSVVPENRPATAKDLAPIDQFHTRGLAATADLAKLAGVERDMLVLDVGCGLGGPARYLAETFGCTVLGIDLSPDFVDAATYLTKRSLVDRTRFLVGDAFNMPASDGTVDLVWMQHVAMNIAERDRLYLEIHRVLRRGGRLALFDVVERSGDIHFPVPWSRTADTSFLLSAEQTRDVLSATGFTILEWRDDTVLAREWFKELSATPPTPGTPSLGVVMGPDFPELIRNLALNLAEGRVGILSAVLERRA